MKLFPNPYFHLDGKSRLAGAVPIAEAVRPTEAMPTRQSVGAKIVSDEKAYKPAKYPLQSRADLAFVWSGEPFDIEADVDGFYLERLRHQELFEIKSEGVALVYSQESDAGGYKPPREMALIDALAEARMKALDDYRARHLKDADESVTAVWAEQFPHDADVAEAMAPKLAERARVAAEAKAKADAEEKRRQEEAEADAKDPKAAAERAAKAAEEAAAAAPKRFALRPPGQLPAGSDTLKTEPAAPPGSPPRTPVEMTDRKGGFSGELKADSTIPGIGSAPAADAPKNTTSGAPKGGKG